MKKIDRTNWPNGEWDNEPDRLEWRVGDFYCCLNRNNQGGWCGYVGVPAGHRWHQQGYDDIQENAPDLRVHGGVTFAGTGSHLIPPNGYWLVGFDCAHAGDLCPHILFLLNGSSYGDEYRNLDYARGEVCNLLNAAGGNGSAGAVRVWIEDDKARIGEMNAFGGDVTSYGGDLLHRWVRCGDSRLDIAADWLEDHPEYVTGLNTEQVSRIALLLRQSVAVG